MPNCYSTNEEDFFCDLEMPLERAIELFLNDNENFVGETEIQIFSGEKVKYTIGQFLPTIADHLTDEAYSRAGESAESWIIDIESAQKEIQEIITAALENWANHTDNQPTFFGVENVSVETVKVKIDKDGYWSIVEDKEYETPRLPQ